VTASRPDGLGSGAGRALAGTRRGNIQIIASIKQAELGGGMGSRVVVALSAACWLGAGAPMGGGALAEDSDQGLEIMDVERFTDGEPAHGARLYRQYCRGCHGPDGRGGAHTFMPHIGKLTQKDYIEFIPDSFLYTVIAEGGEAVGKSAFMPAWKTKLSEQDIKDIIAHIRTLPTY
jgi:mono/diheme cytochrome c family protein